MSEEQSTNIVTDPGTGTETETKEAPKWHAALSDKFGVDVSSFSDEANALSAIRMIAENSARAGIQSAPASQTPETEESTKPTEITAESLGFDEDDLDPKVLKALQTISARQDKQIDDLKTEHAKQVEQATVSSSSSVHGEANAKTANALIDKLASPKYGVGENRTVPQQLAVNRVFELAELIYKGGSVQGTSVENIVESAILMDAGATSMSSVQGNPPPEPKNAGSSAGEKKIYGKRPLTKRGDNPNDPMGMLQDPIFREGVRRILEG